MKKIFPLLSMALGIILGIVFKEKTIILKTISDIFTNLLLTVTVPLIFLTLTTTIIKIKNIKNILIIVKKTLKIFLLTTIIAILFMITILLTLDPTKNTNIILTKTTETIIENTITNTITVTNFNQLFNIENIIPLTIFSILIALSIRKQNNKEIINILDSLYQIVLRLTNYINYLIPLSLCTFISYYTGQLTTTLAKNYTNTIIIFYLATLLYFIIFYTLYVFIARGKNEIKSFYKKIIPSLYTSLITNSTTATLPINIKTADKLNINKTISKIVLTLGTIIHNQGTAMGTVLKIMFVTSLFNIPLTLNNYILIIIISIISSLILKIPNGKNITNVLIVILLNLPVTTYPILIIINTLITLPTTILNTSGNITNCLLIEKNIN